MGKVIAKNKDAYFNYELTEFHEAGVVLLGWEVKSIRGAKVSLKGAFCAFKNNELFISGMNVTRYMNVDGDPLRLRKLLLHQSQLKKIYTFAQMKGHAIVATQLK